MNSRPTPGPRTEPLPEPSVIPSSGWHCGHYFYRFRRDRIDPAIPPANLEQFRQALNATNPAAPERLAAYWTSGHRADFAVMVMDPDPAKVDAVHQPIIAPRLGRFVEPDVVVRIDERSQRVRADHRTVSRRLIAGATRSRLGRTGGEGGRLRAAVADDERATFAT